MTSEVPEEELAERAVHEERESPEEYEADERETAVSDETGTVYDVVGETETTPHDEEIVAADEE
jgi:hypothetical protein